MYYSIDELEERALNDDAESMYLLARIYRNGNQCEKDVDKAIKLLQKATSLGHPHACVDLAFLYLNGVKREFRKYEDYLAYFDAHKEDGLAFVPDKGMAMRLFCRAYDYGYVKKPEEYHPFEMAYTCCVHAKDKRTIARELVLELIKHKDENLYARFVLGRCYDNGIGVKVNKQKAYELYKLPAKLGNMRARNLLAWVCFNANDEGTLGEFRASDMFKELIEQDVKNAYYGLGLCYFRGIGDADCCHQLGKLFLEGIVVEKNDELAEEYLLKGVAQKNANCVQLLANYYYSQGTPDSIMKCMQCHNILNRKGYRKSVAWLYAYCTSNNTTMDELNEKMNANPLGITFTKCV